MSKRTGDAAHAADDGEPTPGSVRPGGRTERVRQAVASAALALLRRGQIELSPALVAQEAGVGRSTVHRRWPTRAHLLREAHELHTANLRVPDTGSFESDIRQLARRLARFFSNPTEIALSSAMAAHTDPEFNDWQIEYWERNASELGRPFERAFERGELQDDIDVGILIEMLIGPMVTRTVVMKQDLPARFVKQLADHVIRAATSH